MLVKRAYQEIQLSSESMSKLAVKEKRIIPIDNETFRYLRFRAIGCMEVNGFNGNQDSFLYGDFCDKDQGYGYESFRNKRAHVEHNSAEGHAGSIGDLPDAYLNKFIYSGLEIPKTLVTSSEELTHDPIWNSLNGPKHAALRSQILNLPGQRDGAIEVLMRIDLTLVKSATVNSKTKQFLDRLARMIDTGQKLFCSMGTNVAYSTCSVCGNDARFATDYCGHMKRGSKGAMFVVTANSVRDMLDKDILRPEWLPFILVASKDRDEVLNGISNRGVTAKSGEINHKLSFFELSIVHTPAFEQADAIEKLASQFGEDRKSFLKAARQLVGDDNLFDMWEMMRQEGIISTACSVRM